MSKIQKIHESILAFDALEIEFREAVALAKARLEGMGALCRIQTLSSKERAVLEDAHEHALRHLADSFLGYDIGGWHSSSERC